MRELVTSQKIGRGYDPPGPERLLNWFKLGLTYCVPFCVATYGAFAAARIFSKQMRARREGGGRRTL